MSERRPPHCALLLELLADGVWHSHLEIYALNIIGHSRIAELCNPEKYGYSIERKRRKIGSGELEYLYRLVACPAPAATVYIERLEARLSDSVRARLASLRSSSAMPACLEFTTEAPPSTPSGSGHSVREEALPCETSTRSAAAPDSLDEQLGLDEIMGLENELQALRSLDALTAEDVERLDVLTARHEQLARPAA